ncbi:MAG: PEGA domain-containing protein [FCB group bacterium]|nr:PEGA domain-containing protein [FCB group bacterium]
MSDIEPIRPNPYIVGNPIKSDKMFYGRQDDFNYVRTKMSTKINQIIVLYGQRRCGKTSILFQIQNGRLGPDFIPILIDMQTMAGVKSDSNFYLRIISEINNFLERTGIIPANLDIKKDDPDWLEVFRALFNDIRKKTGDKSIILLFDEYEIIEQKVEAGELSRNVVMQITNLLESRYNIGFIFTGSMHLEERRQPYWNHLLSKSIARRISFLTQQDTHRLCTEPLAGKITYVEDSLNLIYRLTAGHPFYTQVVCQNLIDLLNENKQRKVTNAYVEDIVQEIVENPLPQMIYYWDSMADAAKVVLSLLTRTLSDGDDSISAKDIFHSIAAKKYDIHITEVKINEVCEHLYHDDLLNKIDHDNYNFRVDIFRRWIKMEHSVWQVTREIGPEYRKRPRKLREVYLAAVITIIAAATGILLFKQSIDKNPENVDGLFEAVIISNVTGVKLSLNNDPAETYQEKTIHLDSLSQGEHVVIAYPPDSLWTPDSVICFMNILEDRQFYPVDFTLRAIEEQTDEMIEADRTTAVVKTSVTEHQPEIAGILSVSTQPEGARIFLDNSEIGISPISDISGLLPGTHQLRLEKEGFRPLIKRVNINRGESFAVVETLEPLTGGLTVYVMGMWADVKINGKSIGRTPCKDLVLPIGKYEIILENPAFQPYSCTVEIIEGELHELSVQSDDFNSN